MGHLPLDGLVLRHKSARSFASDASYVSSCLSWLVTSRIPALLRHLVMKAGGRHFTRLYPFLSLSLSLLLLARALCLCLSLSVSLSVSLCLSLSLFVCLVLLVCGKPDLVF